ncbi:hypothetical protein [Streptomyces sp. C10-9-1]|uniref:hypothetical protein n=1 Tax=Streptomyces sp. C10-9-1 TaxID=1859285 RepID=UPI003F49E0EF
MTGPSVHVDDLATHLFLSTDRLYPTDAIQLLLEVKATAVADAVASVTAEAERLIPANPAHRTLEQRGAMKVIDALRAQVSRTSPATSINSRKETSCPLKPVCGSSEPQS